MRTLLCSEAVPEREPPRTAPPAPAEHVLMQLQRTAGNAAVSRLVAGARGPLTVARCPDCGGTCKDAEEEEEEALERPGPRRRAPSTPRPPPPAGRRTARATTKASPPARTAPPASWPRT